MGRTMMSVAVVALMGAAQANAQRVSVPGPGASYPPPGATVRSPPVPPTPLQVAPASRWGSNVGGRWWGGANAPGGWAAYRAPYRGYRLPAYWAAPRFTVTDWRFYGLPDPPAGQRWVRYYDEAVLIDDRGEVRETVGRVDWDYDNGWRDGGYAQAERERRDRNGVAGAAAGAVVGGVAGTVIAGRGNRLGGTLIGAGLGAAAGYAAGSRAPNRDRALPPPPPPPPGAGYRTPLPPAGHGGGLYDHGPGPGYPPPAHSWSDGRTTVTVTTNGGPAPVIHAAPPPRYGYGAYSTTVTVQTAPVVTTTTTETFEDHVTYTRPAVRRVAHKRLWRPRGKSLCRC